MRYFLPAILCFSLVLFSFTTKKSGNAPAKCTYGTFQGRFDGKYVSYYNNGQKKAEGKFRNNYREGKWQFWNESGQLVVERNYINPFEFTQAYPKLPQDAAIYTAYKLERDANGCYRHFTFKEERVLAAKRLWRFIGMEDNRFLFSMNTRLFRVLDEAVKKHGLKAYGTDSLISPPKTNNANEGSLNIIGFRTMEDWVFDDDRRVGEYYTIAICPVSVNPVTKDTTDLYWVGLDQARPFMAKEYMNDTPLPKHIETLDDIFFFHYFHGQIYKEGNPDEQKERAPLKTVAAADEALKIDLNMIDNEHNLMLWLATK